MYNSKFFRILSDIYTEKRFITPGKTPKKKKYFDLLILFLAFVSIILFVFEEITEFRYFVIHTISVIIDYVFLTDYSLRFFFSGRTNESKLSWSFRISKNNYVFRWYGLIDLISVLPPLIYHVLHVGSIIEEYSRAARLLRILRAARILRILRSLRFIRYSEHFSTNFLKIYRKINKEFKITIFLIFLAVVIGSYGLLWYAQVENNTGLVFHDTWEAMYWSMLNIMGQGEGSVHGLGAQLITLFLMFTGIAFFGIITGSISTFFMERIKMNTRGTDKIVGHNHILICGWNSKLSELLGFLQKNKETERIVLLFDRGNTEEHFTEANKYKNEYSGKYIDIKWVKGNPTEEDDLERASALTADKIIILADASSGLTNETDIDSRSLMALIKLVELADTKFGNGSKKLDITIELMCKTSVKFAKTHKAKHIVYSDELVSKYITSEFQNDLPVFESLIESQKINVKDLKKILPNIKNDILKDIRNIVENEFQSVFFGLIFKKSFISTFSAEKINSLTELLKSSGINHDIKSLKNKIDDKNDLIIFNPWNKINQEIINFLLKDLNIQNINDDQIQYIIISNQ